MPITRYTRWTGSLLDSLDLEDLLDELSQFFLQSGFNSDPWGDSSSDLRQSLREAIAEKLVELGHIPPEMRDNWVENPESEEARKLDDLVNEIIRRMIDDGWLRTEHQETHLSEGGDGHEDNPANHDRFELTSKAVDFLGFRQLRHLLGSVGRSSLGRHETAQFSTGVEAYQESKEYEFGDTINLDIAATLTRAISREGLTHPIKLEYSDVMVRQTEYESSCSTVLLLDTSHSMVLYGEDRFTPAKRVALALSHLIRTQYPGDSLRLVLFHDSAEEVPLKQLARVVVGRYHTNTREGLRLARRILMAEKKDMKQIIMITDGKPSAMTMPNGRIYKSAFGLDPMILDETFKEVAICRKAGILINTFMLASDRYLVEFVKKVTEICRGKAYFTTTLNLGEYILMDYLRKKTQTIH
ncbi:MAG TPA: VWA domain-containing protein [Terriglobia bacterium]|nr:VWA domain-containing protein [Terriglobia bacterium]